MAIWSTSRIPFFNKVITLSCFRDSSTESILNNHHYSVYLWTGGLMVMTGGVLALAADAFLSAMVGKVATGLLQKLQGDPAQKAFKIALGLAIQRYAKGDRLALSHPLTHGPGLLTQADVANELVQIVRFNHEPDFGLIGHRWGEALSIVRPDYDLSNEARLLVGYLEEELRGTEVFRPVFDSRSLDAIADRAEQSTESLAIIEQRLERLVALLDSHFGQLARHFGQASPGIREHVYYFSGYIDEKTDSFVGRQWVFNLIDQFLNANQRGYFLIIGDPGIGKSALAAQIVKQNGYVHHFNIRAEGINKAGAFLGNICAQLIARYGLDYSLLPPNAVEDAAFLNKLLAGVSSKLDANEKCVIVVDGLDEVVRSDVPVGQNLLHLPTTLPDKIYLVVTMRDEPDIVPRVDSQLEMLTIRPDFFSLLLKIG